MCDTWGIHLSGAAEFLKNLANWGSVGFCPSVAAQLSHYYGVMSFLAVISATKSAVPTTALDRIKAIPPDFWLRLAVAVLAIFAIVFFLRKVANMNKVVLTVVTGIIVTVIGFNWIYERSEPAWATPMVSFLAGYFPTKGPPPKKSAEQHANWR